MGRSSKRMSWTDPFRDDAGDVPLNKEYLFMIDDILHEFWGLGRNIVLVWTPAGQGMDVIVIPHYLVSEVAAAHLAKKDTAAESFLQEIVAGPKMVSRDHLKRIGRFLKCEAEHVALPFVPGKDLPSKTISSLVKRYSITYAEDRAVALFDAVEFSLYSPLEQVTQLNSLAYSVNAAYSKLFDKDIQINFARTTTGDGFYVWNRERSINANVNLYHFMHLVLADNAIARSKAAGHTVPLLRTCFHVGGHYEFYQSEGLSPTAFNYIVGDVTIELARMINWARAGQILMGSFHVSMFDPDTGGTVKIDTVTFIERVQERLSSLDGLVLAGDPIDSIHCYLTGGKPSDGCFNIKQYCVKDKHGMTRNVFNAKVNIHRKNAAPIFLGIQDSDLSDFDVAEEFSCVDTLSSCT